MHSRRSDGARHRDGADLEDELGVRFPSVPSASQVRPKLSKSAVTGNSGVRNY